MVSSGSYDCNFLKAYDSQDIVIKIPGLLTVQNVFWFSVFCVPYSISFAHVYLPYKDMSVPMADRTISVIDYVELYNE